MFTEYVRQNPPGQYCGVFLNARGLLQLSARFARSHVRPEHRSLVLFFDSESGRIGIRPSTSTSGSKIIRSKRSTLACARGFQRQFNVRAGRYSSEWNEELSMFICNPVEVSA